MNTIQESVAPVAEVSREYLATINGVEYSIEARQPSGGEDYWWVTVKEYQPDLKWWKIVFSESVHDVSDHMEAMRFGIRGQRGRMRRWLDSWMEWRFHAAQEHGGKRGHYTRLANQAREQALKYAPLWRVGKSIWREITKL